MRLVPTKFKRCVLKYLYIEKSPEAKTHTKKRYELNFLGKNKKKILIKYRKTKALSI